ncbi:hypothetical protein DPMN_159094 [Dreissena polymorpha]|uniref:Uncharacterized protein n=1 Tax=Dreissena polymorpha TaxID=45954 RepID=A0A9D4EIG4_DREPO|nr:hypothetical protein DPMN_159094 [Dreissena polymorpha]
MPKVACEGKFWTTAPKDRVWVLCSLEFPLNASHDATCTQCDRLVIINITLANGEKICGKIFIKMID